MLFRWLLLGVPVTSFCIWHWELLDTLTVILNEICKKDLVFLRNPVDVLVLDAPPPATSCLSEQSPTLFGMIFPVMKIHGVEPHTPFLISSHHL